MAENIENLVSDAEVKETVAHLDLARTGGIFDSLIERSKINVKDRSIDTDELKNIHAVIRSGNLHVKTAGAKIGAIRLSGYRNAAAELKRAVDRKVRDERKSGSGE